MGETSKSETGSAGDDEAQAAAWKQAGEAREGMPPPTGGAVATVDAEKDMIRGFQSGRQPTLEEQKKAMRGPATAETPETTPGAAPGDESFEPPPEVAPQQPPRRIAASNGVNPTAEEREGLELEQRLLGGAPANGGLDDLPDTIVKIGGRDIPLSRIRNGLEAAARRDEWTSENTRREQALARANDTMIAAAQELRRDPLGAMNKLGVNEQTLLEQLRQRGLAVNPESKPVEALPEDADPLAKALFAENQALKRHQAAQGREIDSIKQHLASTDEQSKAAALRQQNAAALSGAKSELVATAVKMPSMQESVGKLNPTGKAIVELASTRLMQEVAAFGRPVDAAALRPRAQQLFSEIAREIGVTPKAQQARAALSGRKNPVPTVTGTTVPVAAPGQEKTKPGSFNFGNDEERRAAAEAWMVSQAET